VVIYYATERARSRAHRRGGAVSGRGAPAHTAGAIRSPQAGTSGAAGLGPCARQGCEGSAGAATTDMGARGCGGGVPGRSPSRGLRILPRPRRGSGSGPTKWVGAVLAGALRSANGSARRLSGHLASFDASARANGAAASAYQGSRSPSVADRATTFAGPKAGGASIAAPAVGRSSRRPGGAHGLPSDRNTWIRAGGGGG
jgi:hypothetical protein